MHHVFSRVFRAPSRADVPANTTKEELNVTTRQINISQKPLQFSLLHMFLLVTANCFLFGTDQLIGSFLTSLLLGIPVLILSISILKIENPFFGSLMGIALAAALLYLACVHSVWRGEEVSGWILLCAVLIYPLTGHVVGYTCSVLNMLRSY